MDFFSSNRGKKDGKRSGLFRKKSASPPHPPGATRSPTPSYISNKRDYDFPNSHPRPPVNGYATPERRRDHGKERTEAMSFEAEETNTPSSPFHRAGNRTPERPRKSSEYSREHHFQDQADTRSNASPFHPFRSPSPSPYHTPDRYRDYHEAMYEPEASPFHPAASRSPPPYTTPDHHIRNKYGNEQFEEQDGHVTPLNTSPPSPVHGPYYSSCDDDNQSSYLFPEIGTPPRSSPVSGNTTPVHQKYQIVAVETYEQDKQFEPPELPDESQSFTQQEVAKMRGLVSYETGKESMISEAYVSVANYRVRRSVSQTLQVILDKHGDIAASSKLQSIVTRSYYLETLAALVMELRSTVMSDLTKTRVAEMAAVVKDMESVKIDVSWLKKAVAELAEAVEYLGQYEETKVEREVCERDMKAGKEEMEEMTAELVKREKEIRECRENVTVVAGKVGQLEMKGWRLNKNVELFQSKFHKFQGQAVLLHV